MVMLSPQDKLKNKALSKTVQEHAAKPVCRKVVNKWSIFLSKVGSGPRHSRAGVLAGENGNGNSIDHFA
jgi:hypothetical protein